jgi:hypothetical protein
VSPSLPSLNSFLPWTTLLPVLGVEARGVALPATACCPLCHRPTFRVYNDPVLRGEWYWCSGCGFAGDGVALVAAAGGITIEAAVLKLVVLGFALPEVLTSDEGLARAAARQRRRDTVLAFWDSCRSGVADDGALAPVRRRLGIPAGIWGKPEWRRRAGRFVGRTDHLAVDELFRPGTLAYRRSLGRQGVSGSGWTPLFPGVGWGDLIVLAYHDVPGRIRGFLFVGREGRPGEDYVFKAIDRIHQDTQVGGLAMLDTVLTPHPEFADTAFVIDDPALAIRLQVRHLASAEVPLPIVTPWPGRKRDHWAPLPARTVVCWSAQGPPIAAARRCNGLVAEAPDRKALLGHAERARPIVSLRAMRESARPWADALELALASLPPGKAEELVLGLELSAAEVSGFLRACTGDTRARLSALFADAGRPRGVTVGRNMVIEAGGEWKVPKTGELVMDAVLRIESVVRSRSGSMTYTGRIEYHGQQVPFSAPAAEVEKDTLGWVQRLVAARRLGEVVGTPRWSKHLLTIARQLEPPRTVEGVEVVGWDEGRNAFVLPRLVLASTGEVTEPDYVLPPGEPVPAAELTPPIGLTPGARTALAWGDEATELFWAVAACLMADVLAPALGLPRTSTALVGRGAWIVGGATAAAFGCLEVEVPDRFVTPTKKLLARLTRHRWPVMARRSYRDHRAEVNGRLLAILPPGLVARTAPWPATGLLLGGGWNVVTSRANHLSAGKVADHGRDVIQNYLQDICARRLRLDPAGGLALAIHRDMAEWYGSAAAVRPAWRADPLEADDPGRFADRFGRAINRLLAGGELRYHTGGNSPYNLTRLADGRVHIPKPGLGDVLEKKGSPPIDSDTTTRGLRAAGVLLAERDINFVPGWVVPESWLRQHTYEQDQDQLTARGG